MSLLINLRHLEQKDLAIQGDLTGSDLELAHVDELIRVPRPLHYDLTVRKLDSDLLVQGTLDLVLECDCARCLKTFPLELHLDSWAAHLPLTGPDKVAISNDSVDLTPYIREDILLAFPQHPLCESECGGLKNPSSIGANSSSGANQIDETSSAWSELNKLKL